jgi:hypothetical protein
MHPTVFMPGKVLYGTSQGYQYHGPSRILLHATSLGECRINDFSIGAYQPVTDKTRAATGGVLDTYYIPHSNHEFIFPGSGVTYNPVSDLTAESAFVDESGAWTAAINMFDSGSDTFATAKHVGENNALLVPLNGVKSGNTTPQDSEPIEEFNIMIRGIRQQDIKEYEIVCALAGSDKGVLLTAGSTQRVQVGETGSLQVGTTYPLNKSAYSCTFKSTELATNSVTYGSIKGGYLKIWVEPSTSGNA